MSRNLVANNAISAEASGRYQALIDICASACDREVRVDFVAASFEVVGVGQAVAGESCTDGAHHRSHRFHPVNRPDG